MRSAELHRLIENLVRVGTVAEVDHDAARVRVESGELLTGWLLWQAQRAGYALEWDPPTVGEQVVVVSPGGDPNNGIAIAFIYSTDHPAPSSSPSLYRRKYPDGTLVDYDHDAKHLTIDCVGSVTVKGAQALLVDFGGTVDVKAGGNATVEAPKVVLKTPLTECTQQLTVKGPLIAQAGMAVSGTAATGGGSVMSLEGQLDMKDGDILFAGLSSYRSHTHPGDSGGTTGGPQ